MKLIMIGRMRIIDSREVELLMAQYCEACSPESPICCDFCAYYFFGNDGAVYHHNGFCTHPDHPHPESPASQCGDYKCFRVEGRVDLVKRFGEKVGEITDQNVFTDPSLTEEKLEEIYQDLTQ